MKSHRPPLEGGPPETSYADCSAHGWGKHHVAAASSSTVSPWPRRSVVVSGVSFGFENRKIRVGFSQAPVNSMLKMREAGGARWLCRLWDMPGSDHQRSTTGGSSGRASSAC